MANTLLTMSAITRFAIKLFINTNFFIQNLDRQYDSQFGVDGAKIGAQLRIRLPNDYTVTDGPGLSPQDTSEQQTILTIATQRHIDVAFTTAERTLSMDDYQERVLKPKVNNLAGNVANQIMQNMLGGIANMQANFGAGTQLLSPNSGTYIQAGALLDDNSTPLLGTKGGRKIILDPHTDGRVATSLQGLLNPATKISQQYDTGTVKNALGFDWFRDQTSIKRTTGTATSATVSGAGQTGTSLVITALVGTLLAGDVIYIPNVNLVNFNTKAPSLGQPRQFVVTANVAAGATAIPIFPAIIGPASATPYAGLPYTPNQYQTVDSTPANGATVTPYLAPSQSYRQSFAYAPDAITMVTADLVMPTKGVVEGARHMMDGVSMRTLIVYQSATDTLVDRLDCLFGSLVIRPPWCCAVPDII
jgi:P22 coat protein - gene protein 5